VIEPGAKVICSEDEWWNGFGEPYVLEIGRRLTVREHHYVAGALFLRFKEIEGDSSFLSIGFKPLRNLH
jgi:hypothetical protein